MWKSLSDSPGASHRCVGVKLISCLNLQIEVEIL